MCDSDCDDEERQDSLKLIEGGSYQSTQAGSGGDAIEIFDQVVPIAICDLFLQDGLEVMRT